MCSGEQNLDLDVLTKDERLVISSDGMADLMSNSSFRNFFS